MKALWPCVVGVSMLGCGSATESEPEGEPEAVELASLELAPLDAAEIQDLMTAEAMRAAGTPTGEACRAACAASYAALCLRVTQICATATVITIGQTTIPCATAIGTACIGGAALASVCQGQCPP